MIDLDNFAQADKMYASFRAINKRIKLAVKCPSEEDAALILEYKETFKHMCNLSDITILMENK